MKAVIMAGGSGTRLRPLTCNTPKPMTEIVTVPAMCHIIRLLKRCGVTQAAVTTMYLAESVEALGNEFEGVKLTYFREDTPMGTAGSVRRAAEGIDEDIIVISGDCICDFDLNIAAEFHRRKNADCTVVLTQRKNPLEYGVALCDKSGCISYFMEKPAWSQVFSGCVNTGIYIIKPEVLRLIPKGVSYDFAKDLFPRLLGGKMYGIELSGYWCDVGSIGDYYRCNFDAAKGKVRGIDKIALKNGSVIGSCCRIEGEVRDSILHSGVTVKKNSRLDGCIVCSGTVIEEYAVVKRGAVIGSGCVVGTGAVIGEGVKIYANIKIPKGSVIMQDIMHQGENAPLFGDSGICGSVKGNLSPERCFALGAGCVIKEGARVGVMGSENGGAVGTLVKNCIIGGISHAGGTALDFGDGNRVLSAHAALAYRQDVMLYVSAEGDNVCIYPLGGDSLTLCGETERKIRTAFESGTQSGKSAEKPVVISGIRQLYISNLVRGKSEMKGLTCAVSDTSAGGLLAEALNILGADVRLCSPCELERAMGEKGLCLEIDDENLRMYVSRFFSADFEHIRAYLVHHKAPSYKNIAIPYVAPEILNDIAHRRGARIFRYLTTPTGGGDIAARSIAADFSQLIFRDVCFAAMQICENFAEMEFSPEKLKAAFEVLPPFSRDMRDIDYEEEKRAELMKRITSAPSPETEGAQLIFRGGRALVIPRRTGGFRIIAEAVSTEAAREISFKTERKLYGKEEE